MLFSGIYRFLGGIETDNFTVSYNEITILGFSLFGTTADVTYYADVNHFVFLHATSGGLSPTAAISLCRFLAFYCSKIYLASFSK